MGMLGNIRQYAGEIWELRTLQRRYGVELSTVDMIRYGWKESFRIVLRQFKPEDYAALAETESENLTRALTLLKAFPFKEPYHRESVRELFVEAGIPPRYYEDILTAAFSLDPEE